MKKLICLVIAVLVSSLLFSSVSKESATNYVLQTVLSGDTDHLEVYVSKALVADSLYILDETVATPYPASWAFFVDDHPSAQWSHDCRYIFVSSESLTHQTVQHDFHPRFVNQYEIVSAYAPGITYPAIPEPTTTPLPLNRENSHLHAVLIFGYQMGETQREYWNDVSHAFNTLTDVYGYHPDNIHVHMLDGPDGVLIDNIDTYNLIEDPMNLDADQFETCDIDYDGSYESIENTLTTLAQTLTEEDQLYVFVTDHGSMQNGMSTICLWDPDDYSEMTTLELDTLLDAIDCSQKIVTMGQCHSGGFVNGLNNISGDRMAVYSSVAADEVSFREMICTYGDMATFYFFWFSAVKDMYPEIMQIWSLGITSILQCHTMWDTQPRNFRMSCFTNHM